MFKFVTVSLLALASLVAAQAPPANDPSINSPASVVQCQPVQLTWTASKEPVYISIIPGGQPGAAPIKDFGVQPSGTKAMTWKCDRKAGESITFQIKDAAGAVAYSGNINVQGSSDNSCVKDTPAPPPASSSMLAASSVSEAPASSPAAPAPAPATSAAASSSRASAAGTSSTRAPAAATSATPTSTGVAAAANAALPGAQIGWTGLMGVLAAFIVA